MSHVLLLLSCAALLPARGAWAEMPSDPGVSAPPPRSAPEAPEGIEEGVLRDIVNDLELDDKRMDKIGALLKESEARTQAPRQELEALRRKLEEAERKLLELHREIAEKVRAELTYPQRERFDELRLRRRGRGSERRRIKVRQIRSERGGPDEQELFMDEEVIPLDNFPPEMWHGDK